MKASAVRKHMIEIGNWVDWDKTCDQFLHGDPEIEVKGIAVCWCCSLPRLQEAEKRGCNLFVAHEPLYSYPGPQEENAHPAEEARSRFLRESAMTILRCHDTWDVMPEIGIVDSWSRSLGYIGEPAATLKYYNGHDLPPGATAESVARSTLKRVKDLGQECVLLVGEPERRVSRIAVGTGAITNFRLMATLGADILILTDDGTHLVESGQWSHDTGIPLIVVNHATAEEPGMVNMADYFADQFDVKVEHIPQGCLYETIS